MLKACIAKKAKNICCSEVDDEDAKMFTPRNGLFVKRMGEVLFIYTKIVVYGEVLKYFGYATVLDRGISKAFSLLSSDIKGKASREIFYDLLVEMKDEMGVDVRDVSMPRRKKPSPAIKTNLLSEKVRDLHKRLCIEERTTMRMKNHIDELMRLISEKNKKIFELETKLRGKK